MDGSVATVEEVDAAFEEMKAKGEIKRVNTNRFVSRAQAERELVVLQNADTVFAARHRGVKPLIREGMGEDQQAAVKAACSQDGLVVVQGVAGSGKSYAMSAVKASHEAAGYKVVGFSLSAAAVEVMKSESGIEAHTLASIQHQPEKFNFDSKTLIAVDEAGMAGISDCAELLAKAAAAGAKVIFLGDTEQLDAIRKGNILEPLQDRYGSALMTTVRRQRDQEFGQAVLAIREKKAEVRNLPHKLCSNHKATLAAIVDQAEIGDLVIAKQNKTVEKLNVMLREKHGIKDEVEFLADCPTGKQKMGFGVGDRIQFTSRMKIGGAGAFGVEVVNNQRAEILDIGPKAMMLVTEINGKERRIAVDLDDLLKVQWKNGQPEQTNVMSIRHSWATTNHKAQGLTVDRALADCTGMNQRDAYVALSRAKDHGLAFFDKAFYQRKLDDPKAGVESIRDVINRDFRTRTSNESYLSAIGTEVAKPFLDGLRKLGDMAQKFKRDLKVELEQQLKPIGPSMGM